MSKLIAVTVEQKDSHIYATPETAYISVSEIQFFNDVNGKGQIESVSDVSHNQVTYVTTELSTAIAALADSGTFTSITVEKKNTHTYIDPLATYIPIDSIKYVTDKNDKGQVTMLRNNDGVEDVYITTELASAINTAIDSGSSSASGLYAPTVIFVSPSGDDATGEKGTTSAYLTISAAQAAASSGDLIRILKGTYTITATLANATGYNYELEDGVIVNANVSDLNILGSDSIVINYKIKGSGSKNAATINQLNTNGRVMHLKDSGSGTISIEGLIINDSRLGGSQVGAILDFSGGNTIYGKRLIINCLQSGGWPVRYETGNAASTLVFEDCVFNGLGRAITVGSTFSGTLISFKRCVMKNSNSSDSCVYVGSPIVFEDCRIYSPSSPHVVQILTATASTWIGANVIYSPSGTNSIYNNSASAVDVKVMGVLMYNLATDTAGGVIGFSIVSGTQDADVYYVPTTI